MVAYTVNIAGSLAGIAGFALVSYLRAPPSVWFAVGAGALLLFPPAPDAAAGLRQIAVLVLLAMRPNAGPAAQAIWSPYYKITYRPGDRALISTNNIGHQ